MADEEHRCNEDWHEQANASHDTPPSELYDTSDELWWERRYPEPESYREQIHNSNPYAREPW